MNGRFGMALTITLILSGAGQPVFAQDKPAPIVEAVVGQSGFIDEGWDYFGTIGGGVRVFVTRSGMNRPGGSVIEESS